MMSKINKNLVIAVFFIFSIFLSGCQNKELQKDDSGIGIIEGKTQDSSAAIDDNLEKEFDDNLDSALNDLEEIENI